MDPKSELPQDVAAHDMAADTVHTTHITTNTSDDVVSVPSYNSESSLHDDKKDGVTTTVNALGPEPTEEEMLTLRRVSDSLPKAAWMVALVELGERFTYYGITGPFQNYMQRKRGFGEHAGALDLGQSTASALSYFFQFWCYVTPILGAIIADTWWGKYKTLFVFAIIYVLGNLILFVTSLPTSLDAGAGLGGLVTAMIVIGLGTGGIKSNVSPLISEQYTNTKFYIRTLKTGERVIVDPNVTIQSIFMIFYMCINVGSLSAIATTNLERYVDFWAAYLLPFLFFFVAIAALILGNKYYVKRPPSGSVIPQAFRVLFMALKKKNFDNAKPSIRAEQGEEDVPWTDLFVDEVRRAFIACKVFVIYPIYWVVYGQMLNNFVSQAGQMQTHGIPNDIMQNIDPLAIIIFIPIMEKFVYPGLRRVGIKMRPITRITLGFMFASCSMAYAAIVQKIIYSAGPCYESPGACPAALLPDGEHYAPNNVHVAVQTPAYAFIALSEIFASITGLEYAYTKAPASMKSFIMSIFLFTNAIGAAIGIALSPTAKDPKLIWTYTGLACASFVAGWIVWFGYRHLNAVEDELNIIDAEYTAELNANILNKKEQDDLERNEKNHKTAIVEEAVEKVF